MAKPRGGEYYKKESTVLLFTGPKMVHLPSLQLLLPGAWAASLQVSEFVFAATCSVPVLLALAMLDNFHEVSALTFLGLTCVVLTVVGQVLCVAMVSGCGGWHTTLRATCGV